MLKTLKTEVIKHFVKIVLAVGVPAGVFVSQFDKVQAFLTKTFSPTDLSTAIIFSAALVVASFAWGVALNFSFRPE